MKKAHNSSEIYLIKIAAQYDIYGDNNPAKFEQNRCAVSVKLRPQSVPIV